MPNPESSGCLPSLSTNSRAGAPISGFTWGDDWGCKFATASPSHRKLYCNLPFPAPKSRKSDLKANSGEGSPDCRPAVLYRRKPPWLYKLTFSLRSARMMSPSSLHPRRFALAGVGLAACAKSIVSGWRTDALGPLDNCSSVLLAILLPNETCGQSCSNAVAARTS